MAKRSKQRRRTTIAEDRRKTASLDTLRDLKASLAKDPKKTTRAVRLRELKGLPRKPTHPLDLYLRERGVSRARGAEYLELPEVIRDWKRPAGAEDIAAILGEDVDDLFPRKRAARGAE